MNQDLKSELGSQPMLVAFPVGWTLVQKYCRSNIMWSKEQGKNRVFIQREKNRPLK